MQNYIKEIMDICGLPFDEVTHLHRVLQVGSQIVYVSNYKKIISYGSQCITLKLSKGIIKIEGDDLIIKQMDKGEIIIYGKISAILDGDYEKK